MENTSIRGLRGYLKTDPVVLRLLSTYAATQKAQKAGGIAVFKILAILNTIVWTVATFLYIRTVQTGVYAFRPFSPFMSLWGFGVSLEMVITWVVQALVVGYISVYVRGLIGERV